MTALSRTKKNIKFSEFLNVVTVKHTGDIKYNLDRIHYLLSEMGHPENKLKGIHIAGTNGKGSTSAISNQISLAHKKTTGLNTSPHLIDYRERIRINGRNISAQKLIDHYSQYQALFEGTNASFFEITTAIAFSLFAESNIHTSIIEVGLGGRLDGTNPFPASVSVITTISLDHTKTLGDSLEKIAFEKAGIIKNNKPVVIGALQKSAFDVIESVAMQKNSELFVYEKDFYAENIRFSSDGTYFDFVNNGRLPLPQRIRGLHTNLIGKHQAENASLAISAFALYYKEINEQVNIPALKKALKQVNWKGRMQIIGNEPLTILDCAHNEEGIKKLIENIKSMFPTKKIAIVLAILRDKNYQLMIELIGELGDSLYIAQNSSERAATIEEQTAVATELGLKFKSFNSIKTALDTAIKESKAEDIVIVAGSIFTVAEVLADLKMTGKNGKKSV